jgi:hypothetical protein
LHSSRVREKRRVVILTQEFTDESAHLSVCVAHICCRYRVAGRNLRPDRGDGTDDGPGQLDFNCSNDHDQEEALLEVAPRQKEVEEIVYSSDQLTQSKVSLSQRTLTQPSRLRGRDDAGLPDASHCRRRRHPGGSARRRQAARGWQSNERPNFPEVRFYFVMPQRRHRQCRASGLNSGHSFRLFGFSLYG